MAYDGAQFSARVDGLGNRDLARKIVDNVLSGVTYGSRLISSGKEFIGKTHDITLDVLADTQGQWITGLETLNSSATSTFVTTSYARTFYTFPVVSIMTESFANAGALGIINLDVAKYEKACEQVLQGIGVAIFGTGAANSTAGLESVIDDGTNAASIGGISRSTYTNLKSTSTASASNKLTLAQMATLHDNISAAGLTNEEPNFGLTTKGIWSLYEQLLAPNVRASYNEVGYNKVRLHSKYGERNSAELRNSAGFTALSYRNMDISKDDMESTAGLTNLYMINESYLDWYGHSEVPEEYKNTMDHVDLSASGKAIEGTGIMANDTPSAYHGFFYQSPMQIPEQGGKVARFWVIGNLIGKSFRRQGKLTAITGV